MRAGLLDQWTIPCRWNQAQPTLFRELEILSSGTNTASLNARDFMLLQPPWQTKYITKKNTEVLNNNKTYYLIKSSQTLGLYIDSVSGIFHHTESRFVPNLFLSLRLCRKASPEDNSSRLLQRDCLCNGLMPVFYNDSTIKDIKPSISQ